MDLTFITDILNTNGNFITSLAGVLTALGIKDLILDRWHRNDTEEDRDDVVSKSITDILHKVTSIETRLSSLEDNIKKIESQDISFKDTDRIILSECIIFFCHLYITRGSISEVGLKQLNVMYNQYHNVLGGNSFVTNIYERAIDLPLCESPSEDKDLQGYI